MSCSAGLLLAGVLLFAAAYVFFADDREDRLAIAFVATAFFLVLFTQRFYIVDRMNTFFKLYLEAWLLFAIATAVLVFRRPSHSGTIDRWPLPAKAGRRVARGGRPLHERNGRPGGREPPLRAVLGAVPRRAALPRGAAPGRVPRGRVAAAERRRHARPPRGPGPVVPGLRPDLDADRAADGPRLGLPRQAARESGARDRDAQGRDPRDLLDPRGRLGGSAAEALPRRLGLRRLARAQDLSRAGPPRNSRPAPTSSSSPTKTARRPIYRVGRGARAGRPASGAGDPARERRARPARRRVGGAPGDRAEGFRRGRGLCRPSRAAWRRGRRPRAPVDRGFRQLAPPRVRPRRRPPRRLGRARLRRVRLPRALRRGHPGRRALRRRHLERPGPGLHGRRPPARHGRDLYGPRGIAVAPDGRRLGDGHRQPPGRLLRPASLRPRRSSGRRAPAPASSRVPSASPCRPDGEVFVADTGNRRIQVLGPDGTLRARAAVSRAGATTWSRARRSTPTARSTPPIRAPAASSSSTRRAGRGPPDRRRGREGLREPDGNRPRPERPYPLRRQLGHELDRRD